MARQTKERAEQTRETLLDAAEDVFFRRGVARASLEEIASVAGLTRGAVYWHFRDKLDLFLGIAERVPLPHEEMLVDLGRSIREDPLAGLEDCVASSFGSAQTGERKRIQLTVLLLRCDYVGEMAPALERQAESYRRLVVELQHLFRKAAGTPAATPDWPPEMAAQMFYTLIHGAVLRWLREPDEFQLGREGLDMIRRFLGVLRHDWFREERSGRVSQT